LPEKDAVSHCSPDLALLREKFKVGEGFTQCQISFPQGQLVPGADIPWLLSCDLVGCPRIPPDDYTQTAATAAPTRAAPYCQPVYPTDRLVQPP